ncbi:hypothetical protein ACO1O0_004185 [Amphichorda felina]
MSDSAGSVLETTKANAAAAFSSMTSGPVAQNVKNQTAKASSELSTLAASRRTPSKPAATGQPLTHYHSFFQELLSWKNPRASAIALVSTLILIFAARYLDVTSLVLKLSWMALSVTVAAEVVGKFLFNNGFATQLRPRKYMTVSRETIDCLAGDAYELINFVVIESQRILYVESVPVSVAAAVTAFTGYLLSKVVPLWGLTVIATVLTFVLPLIYVANKELIDQQLKNASDIVEAQTSQVRSACQKQTEHITAIGKQYAGDYTGKVQEMLRGHSAAAPVIPKPAAPMEEIPKPAAPVEKEVEKEAEEEAEKEAEKEAVNEAVNEALKEAEKQPEKEKEPEFPIPPTEEPKTEEPKKSAELDAPDVPEEPVVAKQEEPLLS